MRAYAALALTVVALALPCAASADDQSGGQNACMQYAFTICSQFIPDRERVASCLMSNRSRVSPACRSALSHFKTASSN